MNAKLYKLTDAAVLIGVHRQTAWKYIIDGKLKAMKTKNNRYLVSQEEIDRYLGEVKHIAVTIYARVSSSENKDDLDR